MRPSILVTLALVVLGGTARGQAQTDISQKTGGECSPAVVSQGKVTITCIGLDRRQQETLRKMPGLIDQLLKRNQSDRDEILAKLEEILRLQRDAEARNADRQFTEQQKAHVKDFLSGKPKFRVTFNSLVGNNEAKRYAQQILSAFGTGGVDWPLNVYLGITTIDNAGAGVSIGWGGDEAAKNALVIRDALKSAGIDAKPLGRLNGSASDEVTVFVSSKE